MELSKFVFHDGKLWEYCGLNANDKMILREVDKSEEKLVNKSDAYRIPKNYPKVVDEFAKDNDLLVMCQEDQYGFICTDCNQLVKLEATYSSDFLYPPKGNLGFNGSRLLCACMAYGKASNILGLPTDTEVNGLDAKQVMGTLHKD